MKKVLIIVPHHDDEVLGFGGSIKKHVDSGNQVHVCFLRIPYDERSHLQLLHSAAAKEILGYQKVTNLLFSEQDLCSFNLSALKKLEEFMSEEKADILYLPHMDDVHQEHHLTLYLSRIATRIWGPNKIPVILSGEIISSSGNGFKTNFNPRYYETLSNIHINCKKNALLCYEGEVNDFPHPRSIEGVDVCARKRGMEAGVSFAEAFDVLRFIQ